MTDQHHHQRNQEEMSESESRHPTSNSNNSNDNEESLGEIWFDTMRRNRGRVSGGNSTPSSPTNSSDQDQEPENEHNTSSSSSGDSQCSRGDTGIEAEADNEAEENEHSHNNTNTNKKEERETANENGTTSAANETGASSTTTTNPSSSNQRRGYQSDDEGFNYTNATSDESSSAYMDAIRLMDLHKRAKELDRQEREGKPQNTNHHNTKKHKQPDQDHHQPKKKQKTQKDDLQKEPPSTDANTKTTLDTTSTSNNDQDNGNHNNNNQSTSYSNSTSTDDDLKLQQRLERNAREKERSGKINDQFNVLRQLLQEAGVVVPKGTKGSILTIAYQFIVNMQQQQQQMEQDNSALKQQIDNIARGSLGTQTAQALLLAAQRNGLHDTVEAAKSAGYHAIPNTTPPLPPPTPPTSNASAAPQPFDPLTIVQEQDYQRVWDTCPVGIAIATMGGTFLDCNQVFQKLLDCNKQQLRAISIFHLLKPNTNTNANAQQKSNLQLAFEKISTLLEDLQSPTNDDFNQSQTSSPIVLPGSIQGHDDLGIGVSLIRSGTLPNHNNTTNGGDAHYLCVTLLRHDHTPEETRPPATLNPIRSMVMPKATLPQRTNTANNAAAVTNASSNSMVPTPQQQNPNQHPHALSNILANANPNPTTASSLSSSGSSEQNHHIQFHGHGHGHGNSISTITGNSSSMNGSNSMNGSINDPQTKQHQQQQYDPSRYYTVG